MGAHMKTTIDIADSLLAEARRVAAAEGTSVKTLVESGLRRLLAERQQTARPFRLRRASFKGKGLQPELAGQSWARVRDLIYEDRGA
jgi:Arc/MetJ family transcription regulator